MEEKDKKKEKEKEKKGAGIPVSGGRRSRSKYGIIHFLMVLFGLFTSLYIVLWMLIALQNPEYGENGKIKWPRPPKLSELPSVISKLYPFGFGAKTSAKAPPSEKWVGVLEDKSPVPGAAPKPRLDTGGLAAPDRPRLAATQSGFIGGPVSTKAFLKNPDLRERSTRPERVEAGGAMGFPARVPRRKYRRCTPGEKPTMRDPCIAESQSWVKWDLNAHPNIFTIPPETIAKLRDPGPYPENIIDEEEEYRPRSAPVELTQEDMETLFAAVTGIFEGHGLANRRAYYQLVKAREYSLSGRNCRTCQPESRIGNDRGAYYGEEME